MNVETITMPREQARQQLRAYRAQLHKRADAEYEAIATGLQAMADGYPVILLSQSIAAGGFDTRGRPNLAIARADRRQVRFSWAGNGRTDCTFSTIPRWGRGSSASGRDLLITVDLHTRPAEAGDLWRGEGYAMVPLIPATVRQSARRFRADRRFILWEVEAWADREIGARPDRDPFLLHHLGGDAYAVEAQWDLTPLERAVMAGRSLS